MSLGRSSVRTVKLSCPSLSSAVSKKKVVSFPVACDGHQGVDLRAVGRALGLDPSTVRLNGHFLSRGPGLVSSLTWDSLLSFFSSRRFPAGDSDRDPVVVQGNPLVDHLHPGGDYGPVGSNCLSMKRRAGSDESPLKKKRVNDCNSGRVEAEDEQVSDDDSLCIKRKLRLEDNNPFKKRKMQCSPGSTDETAKLLTPIPKVGFKYSCINGHGKRLRDDEMAVNTFL